MWSQEERPLPERPQLFTRPLPAFLWALAFAIVAAAAVRFTLRAHEDLEHLETGDAEWIWYTRDIPRPQPVRFYATRDFVLEQVPASATAKVFADRRHAFYINGFGMGNAERQPGDALVLYDLAAQLKPGQNRIAILVESDTGAGGLLFALDLAGVGRNAIVSDGTWRVDLSPEAIQRGARFPAVVWGRPPMHPWGYPRMPGP